MKKIIAVFTSLFLCIGLVGCSSSDQVSVSGDFGKKPKVDINSTTPPKELVTKVLVEGKGEKLTEDSIASADYYGIALDGKKPFDESFSRPKPFTFKVGSGVIKGWTKALVGKRIGSRVLMVVPPELAYGKQGNGAAIKPNATLVFVVDIYGGTTKTDRSALKDSKPKTDTVDGVTVKGATTEIPKVEFSPNAKPPSKYVISVISEGTGEKIVEEDLLQVFPVVYEWGQKEPISQATGKGNMPLSLLVSKATGTQELAGAKVGSRILVLEPPTKNQAGKEIPGYAYVFDVVGKVGQRAK